MSDPHDNPYAAPQTELSPTVSEREKTDTLVPLSVDCKSPEYFWIYWTTLYVFNCFLPLCLGWEVVEKRYSGLLAMFLGIMTVYLSTSYLHYRSIRLRRHWLCGALIVGLSQCGLTVHLFAGSLAMQLTGLSHTVNDSSYYLLQVYLTTLITGTELCLLAIIVGRLIVAIYDAIFDRRNIS